MYKALCLFACGSGMGKTLKEIAGLIGGELIGDGGTVIRGVAGIEDASEGDITFLSNKRYLPYLGRTGASCVIVSRDIAPATGRSVIRVDNPSLAFSKAVSFILPEPFRHAPGIHQKAAIGKAVLGKDVTVGAGAVIEDGACIGDRTVIYPNCYIGRDTKIGADSAIYPNVSVRERTEIGNRVIIHSGTVIGSDGFGFVTVEGSHVKIPQVGRVVIGDDVEIGANVAIDRARFDTTSVGSGTKIDNLVHIAHNVTIGKNCLIVAQVGISGSTVIGDNVIIAGQAGIVGHVTIGDNCIIMAKTGISKDLAAGSVVWGTPSQPLEKEKKCVILTQRLPELYQEVKEMKAKIAALMEKNGADGNASGRAPGK